MIDKLKYSDETDKSLGLAGMAISLVAYDGEEYLSGVSLVDGEEPFEMSEEFFFAGNPRFSAKIVWNGLLKQYRITVGMMLGNVMCRAYGSGHNPSREAIDALHGIAADEGQSRCSLDKDEIDTIFNKSYSYFNRLFSHPVVNDVARNMATTLVNQRRLSAGEVFDLLQRLNSI